MRYQLRVYLAIYFYASRLLVIKANSGIRHSISHSPLSLWQMAKSFFVLTIVMSIVMPSSTLHLSQNVELMP